jgi:hypothetical protein
VSEKEITGTDAAPRKKAKPASRRKSSKRSKTPRRDLARAERPFPRVTLEYALRVPTAIKDKNAGNPYASEDVATALGIGAKGTQFFYVSAGARDYGLTVGTRDSEKISLTELGRAAVYPSSPVEAIAATRRAFLNIDVFRRVLEHFRGINLPEMQYLSNTLVKEFSLHPDVHDDFVRLFQKNCEFLGITMWPPVGGAKLDGGAIISPAVVTLSQPQKETGLLCFVIMPFTEREEQHPEGFFEEVLRGLIVPAATEAGFTVRSARRQGSDVIQQTIVNDLLQADLVIADLTEHNPNVMFELGMRMALDKPVALIRSRGTGGIFDVDNMLRVFDYDSNLWPSTIERDLPQLKEHVAETWKHRDSDNTYMKLLGRPATRA